MAIAELQVYEVEEADVSGGVCIVRVIGGVARPGQVYAAGGLRLRLTRIEAWGGPRDLVDPPHAARAHLTGPMVALLAEGQVLTCVPPAGHTLADLETWLAGDPPLCEEPHPEPLRALAVNGMHDEDLPEAVRLRWGRVALAAIGRMEHPDAPARAAGLVSVRGYLIGRFGPGRGGDPAELCRELLALPALLGLTPEQAREQARDWRALPRGGARRLRQIKGLLPWLTLARPHLAADDPLRADVDAWLEVGPALP
ncbi:hypothetical protein ABZ128_27210 [Streptomyces sp. NPDC006326]|uniref:hypothetical protein n=1 Tax=Streptomyces sp. NPDC006326 TaxID=3156752 RepID=UPI0033AA4F96